MTSKNILKEIGGLDYDLIIKAAPCEKEKYQTKNKWGRWVSAAACFALAFLSGFVLMNFLKAPPSEAGGLNGKINVKATITVTGEEYAIFDEEAFEHINAHKNSIINELNACGVSVSALEIKEKGYSHVRTGDDGNSMALNWRDYLLYSGEDIVAILSLTKDDGGIKRHISFGGKWFSYYTNLLEEYSGTELVFIYIGDVEAFITPDNRVIAIMDIDVSKAIEENVNYYDYFKTDHNVYVP